MEHFLYCKENATRLSYPDRFKNVEKLQRKIRTVAIVGAGVMGQGIALSFLQADYKVLLLDVNEQALAIGLSRMWETVRKSLNKKQLNENIVEKINNGLTYGTNIQLLKDVDFIVEAVFENADLKRDLLSKLKNIYQPETIVCSNTSTLDIDRMAAVTEFPERFVGMHFFNPAHLNQLVEVIYGRYTDPKYLQTVVEVTKSIGKVPVIVGNSPGFCGNRMCRSMFVEALKLITQGYLPQEIDEAMKKFGFAMGPFAMQDLIGIDTINRISAENSWEMHSIVGEFCKANRLGRKTGKGWYTYKDGKRLEDPEFTKILQKTFSTQSSTAAKLPAEEIRKLLLSPMVNEAFKIMEEKVVVAPEAIDLIWIYGLGFPLDKGGPMYWAQQTGLKNVLKFVKEKHLSSKESYWRPSLLLVDAVEKNLPLNKWASNVQSKL